MVNITKYFEEAELKGTCDAFKKKFESGDLDGNADAILFYKAMSEAYFLSKNSDDDDKQEYAETLDDDIEEYTSLAYAIEIRGGVKVVLLMKEGEFKGGLWDGEYAEVPGYKQNVYMEMTPATNQQLMKGNPNTDAQFFSGDLTVKGPLKLAVKPREWIYGFFEFLGIELD
jgi:hypothetical protein